MITKDHVIEEVKKTIDNLQQSIDNEEDVDLNKILIAHSRLCAIMTAYKNDIVS